MLAQRGINTSRFQIEVNGQSVFRMKEGNVHKSQISAEQVEAIKTALSDPASLKGTVKITQGSSVLLHVKDGQVIMDSLGLAKQAAKVEVNTPQSPGELLYKNSSQGVTSEGLRRTSEVAANAFRSGASRGQVIEMIKAHDPAYREYAQSKGASVAEAMVKKVVARSHAKVEMENHPRSQRRESQKTLQR